MYISKQYDYISDYLTLHEFITVVSWFTAVGLWGVFLLLLLGFMVGSLFIY